MQVERHQARGADRERRQQRRAHVQEGPAHVAGSAGGGHQPTASEPSTSGDQSGRAADHNSSWPTGHDMIGTRWLDQDANSRPTSRSRSKIRLRSCAEVGDAVGGDAVGVRRSARQARRAGSGRAACTSAGLAHVGGPRHRRGVAPADRARRQRPGRPDSDHQPAEGRGGNETRSPSQKTMKRREHRGSMIHRRPAALQILRSPDRHLRSTNHHLAMVARFAAVTSCILPPDRPARPASVIRPFDTTAWPFTRHVQDALGVVSRVGVGRASRTVPGRRS